jgi:hypothetical protein
MIRRKHWNPVVEMIPHFISQEEYHQGLDQVAGVLVDCMSQLSKVRRSSPSEPDSLTGGKR